MKFSFTKKYTVVEKEKMVICEIELIDPYKYEISIDALNVLKQFVTTGGLAQTKMNFPKKFRGVAKCHESDTFNVSTGQSIAYHKAKAKFDKWINKYSSKMVYGLDSIIDDLKNY